MVVHLKDQPHTMPLDLLKVLLENAENESLMHTQYPSSTSRRPNGGPKPAKRFHHQALANKRTNGYTVHPTQLEAEPEGEPMPQPAMVVHLFEDDNILEKWYSDGFLIGLRQATDISKFHNCKYFNCQKEGHHWSQCQENLSLELQELVEKQEHKERKQRTLKPKRGTRTEKKLHPYTSSGKS